MSGEAWRDGSAGVSVLKRVSSAGLLSALCSITNPSASPGSFPEKPSPFMSTVFPTEKT